MNLITDIVYDIILTALIDDDNSMIGKITLIRVSTHDHYNYQQRMILKNIIRLYHVIETQYVISDPPYNSLLEISLTVDDDFNETSTNVVIPLADKDDTVEFTGEPDSDSLLYFSGEDWQDPDNLTWYSSSTCFESDELSF